MVSNLHWFLGITKCFSPPPIKGNVGYLGCFCSALAASPEDTTALGCSKGEEYEKECGPKMMLKFKFKDEWGPNPEEESKYCEEWLDATLMVQATLYGMVFGVIAINVSLKIVLRGVSSVKEA